MTYTKLVAKSDKILFDASDVSNAFDEFGFTSTDSTVDLSGFSASGTDETQPGNRSQGFSGQMFYTEEIVALVGPLWVNRTTFTVDWQPNGLVDSGASHWQAECKITTFSPQN